MPTNPPDAPVLCDALQDATGRSLRPGVIEVAEGRIIDVRPPKRDDGRLARIEGLVVPAMVNAHAHLELTAVGPRPYNGSFIDWIRLLQADRPRDEQDVRQSVSRGIAMSESAGVATIGDVGGGRFGSGSTIDELRAGPLNGVSFPEFLALGGEIAERELRRLNETISRPHVAGGIRLGLQPHAPYSTCPMLYEACTAAAVAHDLPICTHLAELKEELQFVAEAAGPFRNFAHTMGVWNDSLREHYGNGLSPVQWMRPYLKRTPWLLAHCNYVSDDDIALLAEAGASVAYCPIASEYFNHFNHRYRDMLAAGVNVCLGTDSIICQPPDESQPLGIIAPMRRLFERDATDPLTLLAMATINGAKALRLPDDSATLAPGQPAKFVVAPFDVDDPADPLTQVLRNRYPVRLPDWSE